MPVQRAGHGTIIPYRGDRKALIIRLIAHALKWECPTTDDNMETRRGEQYFIVKDAGKITLLLTKTGFMRYIAERLENLGSTPQEQQEDQEQHQHEATDTTDTTGEAGNAAQQQANAAQQQANEAQQRANAARTSRSTDRDCELTRVLSLLDQNAYNDPIPGNERTIKYAFCRPVLGLAEDASLEDAKRRYRRLSLLLHPDKCMHARAREAFVALNDAYERLKEVQEDPQQDESQRWQHAYERQHWEQQRQRDEYEDERRRQEEYERQQQEEYERRLQEEYERWLQEEYERERQRREHERQRRELWDAVYNYRQWNPQRLNDLLKLYGFSMQGWEEFCQLIWRHYGQPQDQQQDEEYESEPEDSEFWNLEMLFPEEYAGRPM